MQRRNGVKPALVALAAIAAALHAAPEPRDIAAGLQFIAGPINGALVRRGEKALAVYGDPREADPRAAGSPSVDTVLFTHHRRDVVWAGRRLVEAGARAVVPAAEAAQFTDVAAFWDRYATARFHDYDCQTSKVLTRPLPNVVPVAPGERFEWEGLAFSVLGTPGYTRGAVTYLVELGGKRIAFTGDLIYGDGRIFDLYSFQDAISEARIGGYHGYAARLAQLLESLAKVREAKPDVLVPARGPLIEDPAAALARLAERVRRFYANYLSTDALRWYFHDEHMLAKARRVLGPDARIERLDPAGALRERPPWLLAFGTSRLIVAADRSGFLVDCGGSDAIEEIRKLRARGAVASIDGVWITHYHDDHTHGVPELVAEFRCPAFACEEMRDILENPGAYRMPCLTEKPIRPVFGTADGSELRWKEFTLVCRFFPGQTLYHGGLAARKDGGETVFFAGDSFTPTGIDDYCLLNRVFLEPGEGFFRCLDILRSMGPGRYWLVNEHVDPAFSFSAEQIERMESALRRRVELLRDLVPWDDPNRAVDAEWARACPYALSVEPGSEARIAVAIRNRSGEPKPVSVRIRLPEGLAAGAGDPAPFGGIAAAGKETAFSCVFRASPEARPGAYVVTCDVACGEWDLREWMEALVQVVPGRR